MITISSYFFSFLSLYWLQDEIKDALINLVSAATIEPGTKGGLKWALGKGSLNNRFTVVGSWHGKHTKFKFGELDLSLYLKWMNRYDFVSCIGGMSHEITLKMDRAREWTNVSKLITLFYSLNFCCG